MTQTPWSLEEYAKVHRQIREIMDERAKAYSKGTVARHPTTVGHWVREQIKRPTIEMDEERKQVFKRFLELSQLQGPGGPFDRPFSERDGKFAVGHREDQIGHEDFDTEQEAISCGAECVDEDCDRFYVHAIQKYRGPFLGLGESVYELMVERLAEAYEDAGDIGRLNEVQETELNRILAVAMRDFLEKHGLLRYFTYAESPTDHEIDRHPEPPQTREGGNYGED